MFIIRAYQTEIHPTEEQKILIHQTIGVTRHVYNLFLHKNRDRYKRNLRFIDGYKFSRWLNNRYSQKNQWIKGVPSKAVKQSIMNADQSYRRFFEKKSGYPKFKRRSLNGSFYLIGTIKVERHMIFLPKLKWIRLKEYGYIPKESIRSVTVIRRGDRYFVSVLVDEPFKRPRLPDPSSPIGLDMGVKEVVYSSDGEKLMSIYRHVKLNRLMKSLKRQQRKLSRRQKGSNNRFKQMMKVNRLHRRINNIRTDMKRQFVIRLLKRNPQYITIEHLNIKGMMKNRRLSNALQQTGIGYIIEWLKVKSGQYGIELRQVDRFYPSSQICSHCQHRQKITLDQRIFRCKHCGNQIDRDLNAALNLVNTKDYVVLT